MVIAYWTIAGITLSLILSAFIKDRAAQKVSLQAWLFIVTATLLWPITLPFILKAKINALSAKNRRTVALSKHLERHLERPLEKPLENLDKPAIKRSYQTY
jgi:sulfite exporter TauE/SafE